MMRRSSRNLGNMPVKQHPQPHTNHIRKRTTQDKSRPSINALKKRRRDLRRLLEHADNLAADLRIGYERELASCSSDLDTAERDVKRSQMIRKYHMVRFFERKKATRAVKKAQRALVQASASSEKIDLEERAHMAEVDLNYTLYYPLEQAYVSLYADKKEQQEDTPVRTHPMWKVVEAAMAEGNLNKLREGAYPMPNSRANDNTSKDAGSYAAENREASKKRAAAEGKSHRARKKPERRKNMRDADDESGSDNEDGGGFFES